MDNKQQQQQEQQKQEMSSLLVVGEYLKNLKFELKINQFLNFLLDEDLNSNKSQTFWNKNKGFMAVWLSRYKSSLISLINIL